MGWDDSDARKRPIAIRNPLNSNQTFLRTTPLPGVLETIRKNFGYGSRHVSVFSMARVFVPRAGDAGESDSAGLPDEKLLLVLAATRPSGRDFWNQFKESADLFDIKGELETITAVQNIDIGGSLLYDFDKGTGRFTYKNRHKTIAEGGIVPAPLASKYDLDQAVWYSIVDMAGLYKLKAGRKRFKALSEYPVSKRDLSLVTPVEVTFNQVKKCLAKNSGPLLESVQVFDVYQGENLPENVLAFGVRMMFRSAEKTLRDEEIDEILDKVLKKLKSEHGVVLRD